MKGARAEVVRGSGNVFRDVGRKNADVEQFKAILGEEIQTRINSSRAGPERV